MKYYLIRLQESKCWHKCSKKLVRKKMAQSALFQATLLQDESLKRASIERDDTRDDHFGHVCSALFDDDYLLSNILHFEGSLAISETSYNVIVGFQKAKPYSPVKPNTCIHYSGTPSNALVCKKWKSFVIGEKGREAWTIIMNEKDDKLINLANEVVDDESMPWSARLLAVAIADDTASLYRAFDDMEDDSQGIGAAFEEADREEEDDYEENLRSLEVNVHVAIRFLSAVMLPNSLPMRSQAIVKVLKMIGQRCLRATSLMLRLR
mmetsp:Transcript_14474/g.24263  ORF Transcript_14474/g.24263 Transcript_14474/m.24263 type:complete len:265 (+) Transcript_14474:2506-3300(+)